MTELVSKYPKAIFLYNVMKSSFVVAETIILEAHWSFQVYIATVAICPLLKMNLHVSIQHSDLDLKNTTHQ